MTKPFAGGRLPYLVAVAAIFVWAILGIGDMSSATWTGYNTTPQNVINQVEPGSPAEAAGLMVGDEIASIAGIPVEDSRSLNRLPRPMPGNTREIGVIRDGTRRSVSLTLARQPSGQMAAAWAGAIIGLLFLFMPFLASRTRWPGAGLYLGWFGACFALTFVPGPWIQSTVARNFANALILTAVVLGFALLLRFALSFPEDSPAAEKPSTKLLVWLPAAVIAVMFIYLILGEPDATSGLNAVVNLLVGLFVIGYFGSALLILMRRYRAATPEARHSTGLSLVMWGAFIGLLPPLLASIVNLISPMTVLPGQQYYFLSLGLIPIAFSLAVMRSARHAQAGVTA